MDWEKTFTILLTHMGCSAKVNVPINKKRKLSPKTVDCVFLDMFTIALPIDFY
jgi:hypothetical protein